MINENICMECPSTLRLVPYLPYHVARYHEWMCEPELLQATESEPMTLEEEKENQDSWLHSMEKLTFILTVPAARLSNEHSNTIGLLRRVDTAVPPYKRSEAAESNPPQRQERQEQQWQEGNDPAGTRALPPAHYTPLAEADAVVDAFTGQPLLAESGVTPSLAISDFVMVGDCNLFLLDSDELDCGEAETEQAVGRRVFEVEVMVAEKAARRMGVAQTAVRMLMQYAVLALGATHFVAKILDDNDSSIRLFTEKLHFTEYKRVKVFHEIHLVRSLQTAEERAAWQTECEQTYLVAPLTEEVSRCTLSL